MEKKIVILNGSPRKKGNTSALVSEFTRGAKEAGHIVTEFFLDGMVSMDAKAVSVVIAQGMSLRAEG